MKLGVYKKPTSQFIYRFYQTSRLTSLDQIVLVCSVRCVPREAPAVYIPKLVITS